MTVVCDPPCLRRRLIILSLSAVGLLPLGRARAQPADRGTLELAVKAAYLLKFPAFVEWHEPLPPDTFTLCVLGSSPFQGLLRQAAADQHAEQRPVRVRSLPSVSAAAGCQMLYISGSATQSVAAALDALRGSPVLTVTDGQSDPATRGVINFALADGRVRFQVDLAAAAANHLSISSKLLSIALTVRRGANR